jgi:hypothetical protein
MNDPLLHQIRMDEELAKMLQQDEEFIASEILAQRLLLEEEETQRVGVKEIVLEM